MRLIIACLAAFLFALPARAQSIDASAFAAAPHMQQVMLSPNGQSVAYIRRTAAADDIIVVSLSTGVARVFQTLSPDIGRFDWVAWKGDDHLIVSATVIRQVGGNVPTGSRVRSEAFDFRISRVFSTELATRNVVQMFDGQLTRLGSGFGSTFLLDDLPDDPQHILLSAWDNSGHGVWRADIETGRVERLVDGSWDTLYYATDRNGAPVMRVDRIANDSGYRIFRKAPEARDWIALLEARTTIDATNSPDFEIVAPGPTPGRVYVLARPDDRDLAALYLFNAATGEFGAPLQEGQGADVAAPWIHPATRELLAACEFAQRLRCRSPDTSVQRQLNAIDAFFQRAATIYLADISHDASKWLLYVEGPNEPNSYYIFDRAALRIEPVGVQFPQIDASLLAPTQTVTYQARDGTALWAYVTARPGEGRRPMVVMPHGGPESRDYYGYDAFAQFLASKGYVVVQPNFRGSIGFGRAFGDAGRGQWGLRMQDDVTDAMRHMISAGIADPARICIVGASYGGYAALVGPIRDPELYRCAVSIAGVSDLPEQLREERMEEGRRSMTYQYWLRSIGDPRVNRDALIAASPARQANALNVPLLLIHGETDTTVLVRQSELMERAMREAGRPVRFVRIPDSNHYWNSWTLANRLTLYRETEAFLAAHLGAP